MNPNETMRPAPTEPAGGARPLTQEQMLADAAALLEEFAEDYKRMAE